MVTAKALFRLGTCAQAWCWGIKMNIVQTRQCPEPSMFIKIGKGLDCQEIGDASTACKKVNTAGTGKTCSG